MFVAILKSCVLYLLSPLAGFGISLYMTGKMIPLLERWGFIDVPRGRHQHAKPVPRGGGIAIGIAFFSALLLFAAVTRIMNAAFFCHTIEFLTYFAVPALIILSVGVLDDRCELRSWIKLAAQIIVGVIIYLEGCGFTHLFSHQLPESLALVMTIFWSVITINAFNLIDGMDGVAAGLGLISSFLLAAWTVLSGGTAAPIVILLCFGTCCLGFLRYNFPPAKIFLGDTGSMFLGLFFAYVSMEYSTRSISSTAVLVPLAAIGVPMFDVFLAVWRRIFRRYVNRDPNSGIMRGDHDHLHHRILKETGQPRKATYIIYGLSLSLALLAMVGVFLESQIPAMIYILFVVVFIVMMRYSSVELLDTLNRIAQEVRLPHRTFILTMSHPFIDCVLVLAAFAVGQVFCVNTLSRILLRPVPVFTHVVPFVLFLCASGIYRTFWLRVGIGQFRKLLLLLGAAGLTGYVLNCVMLRLPGEELWEYSRFYAIFLLLGIAFILMERFLIHYYESFGYRRLFIRTKGRTPDLKGVLIYGGGLFCRLYITGKFSGHSAECDHVRVVGIVDDDPALRKFNVYGFDVLGSLADLEAVYAAEPFDEIVITCSYTEPDKMALLRDFCGRHGVELRQFICREEAI